MTEYRLIRSQRKTLGLEIGRNGFIVRAPYGMPEEEIRRYLQKKADWIREHLQRNEERQTKADEAPAITMEEVRRLADEALQVIPARVRYYAPLVGVTYRRITIRNQTTRWGSCTSQGNLNFNCLLMKAPPEVLDSVVVHELCHRLEMNHSERFYANVLRVFPNYWACDRWLKEQGTVLLRRMLKQE